MGRHHLGRSSLELALNEEMEFPGCLSSPRGNTFAKVEMAQAWQDLALWESFLNAHPCASLVELGTYRGGFSLFLAIQCFARGACFLTIDDRDRCESARALEVLGGQRAKVDLLADGAADRLRVLLDSLPRPLLLYCDDGNKPAEVRQFHPLLRPDDFLAVHDWDQEIGPGDIPVNFAPVHLGQCEAVLSLTRFFELAKS